MEPIETIRTELGYTREWIDFGIVDEQFLQQQYDEYLHSDDKCQEHYRNGAFWQFLQSKDSLSDAEIGSILRLRDAGPDGCDLAGQRILTLLNSYILTDEQYEDLARYVMSIAPGYRKQYERRTMGRRMCNEGLSEEIYAIVKQSGDSVLHHAMIEHPQVSRKHLRWLEEHGGNKAIRNRSRQMLNSRRFRTTGADSREQ